VGVGPLVPPLVASVVPTLVAGLKIKEFSAAGNRQSRHLPTLCPGQGQRVVVEMAATRFVTF